MYIIKLFMFRKTQETRNKGQCHKCHQDGHVRQNCPTKNATHVQAGRNKNPNAFKNMNKIQKRKHHSEINRYVLGLIIIIINMDIVVSQHVVEGYDCTKPLEHVLVPSPCVSQEGRQTESKYSGWIAYNAQDTIVKGLRCTVEVHLQPYYCGANSHVHLLETPIVKQVSLSPEECNNVYKTKSLNIYNRLYSVEPNTGVNTHGLMINGTLTYGYTLGTFNVFCNPTGIFHNDIFVDYGFQVGTLLVSVTQVPLLITLENIVDYQLDTVIGHWRNCTRGCVATTGSYYIPGRPTNYRLVKHLTFNKYTKGKQVFIVNHTENIHVEIYELTTVKILNRHEQVLITELPDLVLFTNPEIADKVPKLHAKEARYDLASFINTLYKHKQIQNELEQQIHNEVCLKTHRIRYLPSTHYTQGKAITSLGELLRISTCKKIQVTINEGKKDKCYTNHITVQVENVTKAMLPGSRIVFDTSDMISVTCQNHPVFLYIGNHSYLGNKGDGMELIQVKHEVDHLKTHIFWSPVNDAFRDLTVMGDQTVHTSKVTYLNDLTGTESVMKTTVDQVGALESIFTWTLGKNMVDKFKAYFWSIVGLIIIIALGCSIMCMIIKFLCKRILTYRFLPGDVNTPEE